MGYMTNYKLEMQARDDKELPSEAEVLKNLNKITKIYAENRVPDNFDEYFCTSLKWYNCTTDMDKLSWIYADILFTIYAEGEESDDLWISYFLNGVSYLGFGEIIYPSFQDLSGIIF